MIPIVAVNNFPRGEVFAALADPTRRRILELLAHGARRATEVHRAFPVSGTAISRHLRVLRQSELIEELRVSEDARVRLYRLRPEPLHDVATWAQGIAAGWQEQLEAFQAHVEREEDQG